jgi:hypothetical protein
MEMNVIFTRFQGRLGTGRQVQKKGAVVTGLIRHAGAVVVTGVVGAVAVDGVKRLARTGAVRRGAVVLASWGLRGQRSAEAGAETVWLSAADILAEAREKIGEQVPPPAGDAGDAGDAGTHDHDH